MSDALARRPEARLCVTLGKRYQTIRGSEHMYCLCPPFSIAGRDLLVQEVCVSSLMQMLQIALLVVLENSSSRSIRLYLTRVVEPCLIIHVVGGDSFLPCALSYNVLALQRFQEGSAGKRQLVGCNKGHTRTCLI